jgi:phage terminase large subunit
LSGHLKIRAELPEKLDALFKPKRYKILYGGRGGSKSWGIARALLVIGIQRPIRILCCREFQKSIKDSVHQLLKSQIEEMGLQAHYDVLETTIKGKNGTEFIFIGLHHNTTNIKSYEDCAIAWVEEAAPVSRSSWEILIPTIRKEGSEIWISFNPELADDETYKRFVLRPPEDSIVININWRDNPFFPSVLEKERLELKARDYDAYLNIWEGKCREVLEGAVFADELRQAKLENRITKVPHDPAYAVDTYWDLGFADFTSIWFVQPIGLEIRIIDYYQNHLKSIQHYLEVLQARKYVYRYLHLPHDADHQTLAAGGRSIAQMIRQAGFRARVIERVPSKTLAISAARAVFPMCWFDEDKCADGLHAMRHYRFEHDQEKNRWSDNPLHDWASHGADAFLAIGANIRVQGKAQERGGFNNLDKRTKKIDRNGYHEVYA